MNKPKLSRREFVQTVAIAGATVPLADVIPAPEGDAMEPANQPVPNPAQPEGVELRWLEGGTPATVPGVTFGIPWPRGKYRRNQTFAIRTAANEAVPVQTWPIAYWPDGTLKWTAHALGADTGRAERLYLTPGAPTPPPKAISVRESGGAIEVDTGVIRCRIARSGKAFISSVTRENQEVLRDGHLVCLRQDHSDLDESGTLKQESFASAISTVTVEQSGPIRAVVKIEGKHESENKRGWLPFTLRLYFYAGGESVRVIHSFIFDGDENTDFIRGLGIRFAVPLRDALHDRHVRFSGEGDGLWAEAVRGLTGLRRDPGREARQAQLAGKKTPEPFPDNVRNRMPYIPAWGDFTLAQLAPDAFTIRKRTKAGHAWVHAASGRRAPGLGYVGGATGGGVAFGLRDFWQRYPTQLDIRGAASEQAQVTLWLWSPDATAMDLRFYHDGMGMDTHPKEREGLEITYEDYEKGWGTPHGVARTNELTLWAVAGTPPRERYAPLASALSTPPLLVATPKHIHSAGVFGDWSLPDRSTPAKKRIEDQLDYLIDVYKNQIEQRRWYGFWDHGDVMHSYDPDRHEWKYDIGGFAWANSELSPDLWLWYSFLRTGRADIFRMAEAMTRHTGEVDVHHIGRFAGFGSRHNVQHWGDSSKQPRVSTAAYRRIFYYLTADERVGDLMRDLIDSDMRLTEVKIGRKLGDGSSRPPDPYPAHCGFGTDWCSFAAAWLTEWERTGDTRCRDWLIGGMKDIGKMKYGWLAGGAGYDPKTHRFVETHEGIGVSHLSAVFGAVEINAELLQLLDVPEYEKAWLQYCELYNAAAEEQEKQLGRNLGRLNLGEAHSRLTAYAARKRNDPKLAERAWREFFGGAAGYGVRDNLRVERLTGPAVLNPVDEGLGLSTNATSQWGLAAVQNLALIGEYLESIKQPN